MATIAWRIILTKTAFAQRDSPNLRKQQRKDIEMNKIHYYVKMNYIYILFVGLQRVAFYNLRGRLWKKSSYDLFCLCC